MEIVNKLKIALVTFDYDPEKTGGVGNVSSEVFGLLRENFEQNPVIFSFSNKMFDECSRSLTRPSTWRHELHNIEVNNLVTVHRIGAIGSEIEFLRYRKRKYLRNLLEDFEAVIVVTGSLQFCNVLPKISSPVYIQCATRLRWERESQYIQMPPLKRVILRLQLPLLDYLERRVLRKDFTFLAENDEMLNWLLDKRVPNVHKWFPPVTEIISSKNDQRFPTSSFVSVGRLNEPRKGWERLFRAYDLAYSQNPSIPSLKIIGRGDLSNHDTEILSKLNSRHNIQILQNLSNSGRNEVLKSSSIFLQTSHEEGLGMAALEALQLGLPLICSETFGSREYVENNSNGYLIRQDANFIENFAKAILASESWRYLEYSASSRALFEKRFRRQISTQSLLEILRENKVT